LALTSVLDPVAFSQETATGVVLVDFWAPWCGPCKNLMPVLEEMSGKFPQVKFLKVNADESQAIAEQFGVSALPTLVVLKDGRVVSKNTGAPGRTQLRDFIESAL
jgi:thioredoxin 1